MKRIIALRLPVLSAAILSASVFFTAAQAEDCGPLKQVASIDLTAGPGGVSTVPVIINGSPRKLIFDTAGGLSALSQTATEALGLHPISGNRVMLDRAGNASSRSVTIDSLILGGMQAKDITFVISPNPNMGTNPNNPVDGIMAPDIMWNYDTELDFVANKLNYFSPDHCDGHVVYWTTIPASVIEFRRSRPGAGGLDTHIRFHVMLDGKDLLAVLATGSPRSQMSAKVADADYSVTKDTPNTVSLGQLGGRPVFGYVFKTISFGDVTVNNPHVAILPDVIGRNDPQNAVRAGGRIARVDDNLEPDITIGMDVLKSLHVYIAAKENKLYVTAAKPPAAP